jgi:hypothetical protein
MGVKTLESLFADGTHYAWCVRCPACEQTHVFDKRWTFNGDHARPTFAPSMLVGASSKNICHSFLTAGVWKYLPDCTHAMAGQQVPCPDWDPLAVTAPVPLIIPLTLDGPLSPDADAEDLRERRRRQRRR